MIFTAATGLAVATVETALYRPGPHQRYWLMAMIGLTALMVTLACLLRRLAPVAAHATMEIARIRSERAQAAAKEGGRGKGCRARTRIGAVSSAGRTRCRAKCLAEGDVGKPAVEPRHAQVIRGASTLVACGSVQESKILSIASVMHDCRGEIPSLPRKHRRARDPIASPALCLIGDKIRTADAPEPAASMHRLPSPARSGNDTPHFACRHLLVTRAWPHALNIGYGRITRG